MRVERDDVDLIAAAERLDGRAAGIARGRDHDGRTLAALDQCVIHQPRQELHREVLEGERRTVKQLEHEGAGRKLRERRDRRMAEAAVGIMGHAREIGVRDGPADEGAHDFAGDLCVRPTGETGNLFGRETRPGLRDIEAAIAGKTRERHVNEAERGGFASRGNVTHRMSWVADGGH